MGIARSNSPPTLTSRLTTFQLSLVCHAVVKDLSKTLVCAVVALVYLCVHRELHADSVTLIPVEDATISERNPEFPLGSGITLDSGGDGPEGGGLRNRALLKFDIPSNIPSNAIVTSASLTLTLVSAPSTTNLWFSLHKILQDWSESAVTWTNRLLPPPAPWNTPGGASPLDFSGSITQSNLITGVGVFTFVSNPSMVADVQDWASNPSGNSGWALICELEALEKSKRKFASREAGSANSRPRLVVEFALPANAPTLTVLVPTGGQFQFQFNAESNVSYVVEYLGDPRTRNWLLLTNIALLPAPASILVSDPLLPVGNRFYRVRSP